MGNIEHWTIEPEFVADGRNSRTHIGNKVIGPHVAVPVEVVPASQLQGAVDVLRKIERLRAKWDAPDSGGDQAWAAVGSEAHKVAAGYLARGSKAVPPSHESDRTEYQRGFLDGAKDATDNAAVRIAMLEQEIARLRALVPGSGAFREERR